MLFRSKGKKHAVLPYNSLLKALNEENNEDKLSISKELRGRVEIGSYELLSGEKLELIFKLAKSLDLSVLEEKDWNRKLHVYFSENPDTLVSSLSCILRVAVAKSKSKELGFICLFTDGKGTYWYKVSRGFTTALNESLSSIETLIDDGADLFNEGQKSLLSDVYRKLSSLYE